MHSSATEMVYVINDSRIEQEHSVCTKCTVVAETSDLVLY